MKTEEVTFFSTFTGSLGFELGLPSTWKSVGVSEVNKAANMLINYRLGGIRNYGDIQKINFEELPDFKVLVGGSPCQDVSISGGREGLAGIRSRLFFYYVTVLEKKRPDYFIFENVRGLLSSNGGRDFARVLMEFSKLGYNIWSEVLDASWFGVPQHRERVFIVGSLRREGIREILLKPGGYGTDSNIQTQQTNTVRSLYRHNQSNGSYIIEGQFHEERGGLREVEKIVKNNIPRKRVYGVNGIAPTITRKTGGDTIPKIALPILEPGFKESRANGRRIKEDGDPSFTLRTKVKNGVSDGRRIRFLTPLECERLMGWPDDWTRFGKTEKGKVVELSDSARYNLIGNGVVPQIVSEIVKRVIVI